MDTSPNQLTPFTSWELKNLLSQVQENENQLRDYRDNPKNDLHFAYLIVCDALERCYALQIEYDDAWVIACYKRCITDLLGAYEAFWFTLGLPKLKEIYEIIGGEYFDDLSVADVTEVSQVVNAILSYCRDGEYTDAGKWIVESAIKTMSDCVKAQINAQLNAVAPSN